MGEPPTQLRFEPSDGRWTLHDADRNPRWHLYDQVKPTTDINVIIRELDDDPTGIFWG